jgi:hypothetical protein
MTDLVNTGLNAAFPKARDGVLKFHKTDPKTGKKEIGEVKG